MGETRTVYFATNRDEIKKGRKIIGFGTGFHDQGPHYLRFGSAEVERKGPDDYEVKSFRVAEEKRLTDPNPDKRVLGSTAIFEEVRVRAKAENADVLCVLHGYASDFETALARVAEVSVDYATADRPLIGFVFSWPANGRMVPFLDYYSDRDDAKASGPAIARTFVKLCDYFADTSREDYCDQSIHLLAHSMGNWALGHAVDSIFAMFVDRAGRPPRLFDQIFLMAADADNDALEPHQQLACLPELGKAVNVYFSEDDRALMISDRTKTNPDRLGATGPRMRSNLPRKVNLVDCRKVDEPDRQAGDADTDWDLSIHQYYRLRKEVIEDVQQVLTGMPARNIRGREYLPDDLSYLIIPFSIRKQTV